MKCMKLGGLLLAASLAVSATAGIFTDDIETDDIKADAKSATDAKPAMNKMPAATAVLTGVIKDDSGRPMEGVMVRVADAVNLMAESVYTNSKGQYTLVTQLNGTLALRARLPYFKDVNATVEIAPTGTSQKNLVMAPMTDPAEISDSLPAAYHFGTLPFEIGEDEDFSQGQFQRDCLTCHQLGNAFTRTVRPAENWTATIQRMHAMLGNFDAKLRDRRSVILSKGFDGEPIDVRPDFPVDKSLSHTKITEYMLEKAFVPHDAIIHPTSGLIYTVDQALDHMAITDPATGKTRYVKQADGKAMEYHKGYKAPEQKMRGEFNPGSRNGPHSLDLAIDGKYYVTNSSNQSIGVFNPETNEWEPSYKIDPEIVVYYPHTIRADKKGNVWFTLGGAEHVGRLSIKSGLFDIIALPDAPDRGIADGTMPYGMDINPLDNSMWYGRLFGDKIGRVNPDTLEVTEYDSPVRGPRRMHFDKKGVLWVTGFSRGEIARIDVSKGFKSKVYRMPAFAEGHRTVPYALGVHPDTQDIWVNDIMTDRIYRFIPAEERWVVYPVPLTGSYTRDMVFGADGRACMSNNPFPKAALEGGMLQVFCIDTNYDPKAAAKAAAKVTLSQN